MREEKDALGSGSRRDGQGGDAVHARWPGHPRSSACMSKSTWMPGTSPGMTREVVPGRFLHR